MTNKPAYESIIWTPRCRILLKDSLKVVVSTSMNVIHRAVWRNNVCKFQKSNYVNQATEMNLTFLSRFHFCKKVYQVVDQNCIRSIRYARLNQG